MGVFQDEDNAEDTRRQRTLQNLKCYNLKSTIFNFAAAWKEVKEQTLKNGLKNFFDGQDPKKDLEGLEVSNSLGKYIIIQEKKQLRKMFYSGLKQMKVTHGIMS